MKKLLITGFDPFGGESVNPAYEAVRLLPDVVAGIKLCKLEAPPERVAINLMDARIPDNAGFQPVDQPVVPGGPAAYFATLPVRRMAETIEKAGLPAQISNTAGTYVCNCLLYTLLHTAAVEYPGMPGGFIHVPYALEQLPGKPEGTPGLALQQIARGLSCAIEAIAEVWS